MPCGFVRQRRRRRARSDAPYQSITSTATNQTTKRFIITLKDGASPDDFCARRGLRMRKQTRHSPPGFARNLAGDEALVLTGLNIVICHLTDAEAWTAQGERGAGRVFSCAGCTMHVRH